MIINVQYVDIIYHHIILSHVNIVFRKKIYGYALYVVKFFVEKRAIRKTIDSSIMPGVKLECENSNCDFLAAPVKKCGY